MEAPPPSTPWRVERQFEPIERVWVLDADALLVGTYDLATGAVRCCRVRAHAGLDTFLAGWFAATFPGGGDHRSVGSGLPADQQIPSTPPDEGPVLLAQFPPPEGEPLLEPHAGPEWLNPWRGPVEKQIAVLPAGTVPAAAPYAVPTTAWSEITVDPLAGPWETVDPSQVPAQGRRKRGAPQPDDTAAVFISRMFKSGTAALPRKER